MKTTDLDFDFPDSLIAVEPQRPSRVLWGCDGEPKEISVEALKESFSEGDILVLNDTRVIKRRIFGKTQKGKEFEVLFLENLNQNQWSVLCPASRLKRGEEVALPGGVSLRVIEPGIPQIVEVTMSLSLDYFEEHGNVPLPPYIQKQRQERKSLLSDESWYQTAWAKEPGSSAAPTASLHFSQKDIEDLKNKGVKVCKITLHVGLGTFLPVSTDSLEEHQMHKEWVNVPASTWETIVKVKNSGHRVWALGTTVMRTLESVPKGKLEQDDDGGYTGETNLFIKEDFQIEVVDILLTNFHQPRSTLLALVACFAGLENVLGKYRWAIDKDFRLFSYGDLTVWKNARSLKGR